MWWFMECNFKHPFLLTTFWLENSVCQQSRDHCNDIHKYSSHKNVNLNRRAGRTPPTARPSMQQSTRWPPICYPPWLTNGGEWQIWRVYWRLRMGKRDQKWITDSPWTSIIRSLTLSPFSDLWVNALIFSPFFYNNVGIRVSTLQTIFNEKWKLIPS